MKMRMKLADQEIAAYIDWLTGHPSFGDLNITEADLSRMTREELLAQMALLPALNDIENLVNEVRVVKETWHDTRGRLLSSNPPMG